MDVADPRWWVTTSADGYAAVDALRRCGDLLKAEEMVSAYPRPESCRRVVTAAGEGKGGNWRHPFQHSLRAASCRGEISKPAFQIGCGSLNSRDTSPNAVPLRPYRVPASFRNSATTFTSGG